MRCNSVVFNFREYGRAFVNPNADWRVRVCVICACTWRRRAAVSSQPFSLISRNSNHSTFSVSKWYIRVYPSTSLLFFFYAITVQLRKEQWKLRITAVANKRSKCAIEAAHNSFFKHDEIEQQLFNKNRYQNYFHVHIHIDATMFRLYIHRACATCIRKFLS